MRCMGALSVAVEFEVEELLRGDPGWWYGLCGKVSEVGPRRALKEICELRGWDRAGLKEWILKDDGRKAQFEAAKREFVDDAAWERLEIVDQAKPEDVMVAKLRSETRKDIAGRVDRPVWGDRVSVDGGGVPVLDAALVGFAGALLERLVSKAPEPRVIEQDEI